MSTFALSIAAAALAAAAVAAPVLAQPAAGPTFQFSYSDDLTERLTEDYGLREKRVIEDELTQSLRRQLPARVARVEVEVVDVVPNRPTFEQLGNKPGLSFSSFGNGGAELRGRAFDASGALVGETDYSWYGTDIAWAAHAWIWDDAGRAIDRFARKLASDVEG
jgi:hypothetical protein